MNIDIYKMQGIACDILAAQKLEKKPHLLNICTWNCRWRGRERERERERERFIDTHVPVI